MYKQVAIGGTFDRLHKGHQYFISQAFKLSDKVLIGLTSDVFVREKFIIKNFQPKANQSRVEELRIKVNNFIVRKKELEKYLRQMGYQNRTMITKIDDLYGPTLKQTDIEALIVTKDTIAGAKHINQRRVELDLSELEIIEVHLVQAEDKKNISSTRIRLGEIDRWGKVYLSRIRNQESGIKEEVRKELKKPQGKLLHGNADDLQALIPKLKETIRKTQPVMLICIGDEVTKIANKAGIMPDLAVIDFMVNRIKKYSDIRELYYDRVKIDVINVKNSAGYISSGMVNSIFNSIHDTVIDNKKRIIRVSGEEDLAGVPAIMFAPLGSVVIYGQPGEGIVVVEVTEEKKEELLKLIELRSTNKE